MDIKWSAPSRPFKKLSPRFYSTIGVLVIACCLVLVVAGQWGFIAAILAILFVTYVFYNVPPERIHHEISEKGVSFAGHVYLWDELRSFGFKHRDGLAFLLVNTKNVFPGQLIMILEKIDPEEVKQALTSHLPFEERLGEPDWSEKLMKQISQVLVIDK